MTVCLEIKFIPKVSDESVEPNTEESVFTSTCTTTTETSIETTDCESSSCWEDTETEVGSDSDSDETGSDETEFASDYGKFSAPIKNALNPFRTQNSQCWGSYDSYEFTYFKTE